MPTIGSFHIGRLPNNVWLSARNAADNGNVDLIRSNTSNQVAFGAAVASFTLAGSITGNNQTFTDLNTVGGITFNGVEATVGAIRMVNDTAVAWRNFNNSADILLAAGSADNVLALSGAGFSIGTNPASQGELRLPNTGRIWWRNAANNDDKLGINIDGSNILTLGSTAAASQPTSIVIAAGTGGGGIFLDTPDGAGANLVRIFINSGQASGSGEIDFSEPLALEPGGTTGALSGDLRMRNTGLIGWRNAADSADITFGINSSNVLVTTATSFQIGASPSTSGAIRIGSQNWIASRNAAGSADVNLIRADGSNLVAFGAQVAAFTLGGNISANTNAINNLSILSATGSVASVGFIRIYNNGIIAWRNAANSADHTLGLDASDRLAITPETWVIRSVPYTWPAADGAGALTSDGAGTLSWAAAGGGAPTDVDYLVGTASAGLSAEIVVGTTPGGELGGTWGSPTVDANHGGSTHAATQAAAEATAASALSTHEADATTHGITAAAATVLDDATVAAMVDTLGGAAATGTGGLVRAASPTLVTPALGTPASGVGTNLTGIPGSAVSAASASAQGAVELATTAETTTGTDATRAVTPDGLAGSIHGEVVVQAVIFDFGTDCATGDGKFYFHVDDKLGGMNLVRVHAEVITAGTTGTMTIQIHNIDAAVDMLSTLLSIDTGETGSDTAASAAVINAANDDVQTNEMLRIDIDAIHTTAAKGLIVTLVFRLP